MKESNNANKQLQKKQEGNICIVFRHQFDWEDKKGQDLSCEDAFSHGGRCPAAHTETGNVWSGLAGVGHAG